MLFFKTLRKIRSDENGATAVEYGLIVSLVVIAILGALRGVADENTGLWGRVQTAVTDVVSG